MMEIFAYWYWESDIKNTNKPFLPLSTHAETIQKRKSKWHKNLFIHLSEIIQINAVQNHTISISDIAQQNQ